VMLLIIIALMMALAVQRRRDVELRAEAQIIKKENALTLRALERFHVARSREVAGLDAQVDQLSGTRKDDGNGTPKK
jgi:hypothetical protein